MKYFFKAMAVVLVWSWNLHAASLTVKTNVLGATPAVMGYNSGHFYTNSNTGDWWRYAGVNGARLFLLASDIEFSDRIAPWGDGVTDLASFTNKQAALRASLIANPTDATYIDWANLDSRFHTRRQGDNKIFPDTAITEWQQLGVDTLINISASTSVFTNVPGSYADTWELWHRYYEAAFYVAQHYDITRWQMFNEPDLNGETTSDYLGRLKYASDAIQSAIADVNTIYGKNLVSRIHAPVVTGGPSYSSWGSTLVSNRHKNFLGVTDTNFWLFQNYDYHRYGASASGFGSDVAGLRSSLNSAIPEWKPFPICVSEFDVNDNANTGSTTTMDSISTAADFGAIVVNLAANFADELYCFKFSQTTNSSSPPVTKNALHWVDNSAPPYNVGGITRAGEVWRLFNKACAPGRFVMGLTTDTTTANLDSIASYDPATRRFFLFCANETSTSYTYNVDLNAWNIPANQQLLVEEVSSTCLGAGKFFTNCGTARTVAVTQGGNSVLLFTIPSLPQQPMQTFLASEDATVTDGANSGVNSGAVSPLQVKNHSTDTSQRSVAFIKFHLPQAVTPSQLQLAVLSVTASSLDGASSVQAHVYGITNNTWSENSIVWSSAPNLGQGIVAGSEIFNNFVAGAGDATRSVATANSAQLIGQILATNAAVERLVDVTDFLKSHPGADFSFLLAREVRFPGDAQNTDGLAIVSKEGGVATGPRLKLVFAVVPKFNSIVVNSNHTVTLTMTGNAGQTNLLQVATNLVSVRWTTLFSTNVTAASGAWAYTDPLATNAPARFYRLFAP